MKNRLFIFASYDRDGIIDETLLYYLRALSELGDIIFTMDNDISSTELDKVKKIPNVISATASRHGEYDFGSYKRGYEYAEKNNLLKDYKFIYLVNDSVFGPLFNLKPILERMERENADNAFGMMGLHSTVNEQYGYPDHVQSWFVGIAAPITQQPWFSNFMHSVTHQESKNQIVWKYEIGLSQLLMGHDIKLGRVEPKICGLKLYYNGYIRSIPFIKKQGVCNIPKIKTLMKITPPELRGALMANITRLELHQSPYKTIWKLKLFNKITTLMWEQKRDGSEYRLWIFKIIPIKFLRYKD